MELAEEATKMPTCLDITIDGGLSLNLSINLIIIKLSQFTIGNAMSKTDC